MAFIELISQTCSSEPYKSYHFVIVLIKIFSMHYIKFYQMKEIFADPSIKYEKVSTTFNILRAITRKRNNKKTFCTLIDSNIHFTFFKKVKIQFHRVPLRYISVCKISKFLSFPTMDFLGYLIYYSTLNMDLNGTKSSFVVIYSGFIVSSATLLQLLQYCLFFTQEKITWKTLFYDEKCKQF